MKIKAALVLLLLISGCFASLSAQQAVPTVPAATTNAQIDPAKVADIRRLLEISGFKSIMMDTLASMSESIRPILVRALPTGEYREKLIDLFFAKFQSNADPKHVLDEAVPVYDKYYSHEEIKGLIKFYESPLGQKTVSVMPQLMSEMREAGRKWGEQLGRESMQEVLKEHPDLDEAMKAAGKAQQK
jgi:uncharacterized protein